MKFQEILAQTAFHRHGHDKNPAQALLQPGLDADALMQRIRPHRVIGRLARWFEHTSSDAAESVSELSAAVLDRQAYIERRSQRFLEEIVRLQHHLTRTGHLSLLLKGPSVHLVNRGRRRGA